MATLLLRLAAPLQAWGSSSKFNIRTTEREPTKSGVVGMIAAAMGIQRESSELPEPLIRLKFGVRADKEGKLLKDFHMVFTEDITDKKRRSISQNKLNEHTYLTERYYLSDAIFLVGLESDDKQYLENIVSAINSPVYPLFLGRRSCPPTLPVIVGITDEPLVEALKNALPLAETNEKNKRIIYESSEGGVVVQDVPVSFSQLHRIHGYRYKKEEMITMVGVKKEKSITIAEHDPMAEL